MTTYRIIRFYFENHAQDIETGLTLEKAQKHCKDPESSSRTCTTKEGKERTEEHGPWFDGYSEEK